MNIQNIIVTAVALGGIGITFGFVLGIASKFFAVEVDEKIEKIRDALPGSNCGGCGYAGCDALAKAIASDEAKYNACPVGGDTCANQIAEILGTTAITDEKKVAFVKCNGTCNIAKEKYEYEGIVECKNAVNVPGQGSKACPYGCLGLGSCVEACQFDAIHIKDNVAIVDEETCTGCGMCVNACPKGLIELVPYKKTTRVQCQSQDKGKDVKQYCSVGCIGCRLCVKACEHDAIIFENNIAKIDYEKCTQCNACVEKCPVKIIKSNKKS